MTMPPENAPPDPERDEDAPAEEKPSERSETDEPQVGSGEAPGKGGFEGRDPVTDAPRVPSVPESQDDE